MPVKRLFLAPAQLSIAPFGGYGKLQWDSKGAMPLWRGAGAAPLHNRGQHREPRKF